jgi:hypothetical protein
MGPFRHIRIARLIRNAGIFAILFTAAQYVFAVDGKLNSGGGNSGSTSFSHLKKDLNISLRYNLTYQGNRSFGFRQNDRVTTFNSLMTYQHGNVTIAMPYRHNVILPRFRTPSASAIR